MNAAANTSTIRMALRYVVRTIDEDRIDLFDPPSRIDGQRATWDEARRRVREHPELKTVVLDRHTGATLWQSDPDISARYEAVKERVGNDIIVLRDTIPAETVLASSDEDL